jgi:hypothetical protein
MDLDDRVAGVVLAAEELRQLQGSELVLDLLDLPRELAERLRISLLRELEKDLRLVDPLALALPARNRVQDGGGVSPDGLRLLGIVPEAGRGGLLAQLGRAALEAREVKGASRAPARARRGIARGRAARRARSDRRPGSRTPSRSFPRRAP